MSGTCSASFVVKRRRSRIPRPAARGRARTRLIELDRRTGKAANDSTLLQAASGRFCLLLNEDAELCDGAVDALLAALRRDEGAAVAGAQLLSPERVPQACAWRL